MDRRLHLFLLSAAAALARPDLASAQSAEGASLPEQPQVVEPAVKRRTIEEPRIDTENFEAGLVIGTISIEDFGSSMLYGARLAYHFTEDVFAAPSFGT